MGCPAASFFLVRAPLCKQARALVNRRNECLVLYNYNGEAGKSKTLGMEYTYVVWCQARIWGEESFLALKKSTCSSLLPPIPV